MDKIPESWIDGKFNYFRAKGAMSPITGKSEVPNTGTTIAVFIFCSDSWESPPT